jgi:hypothetical protein
MDETTTTTELQEVWESITSERYQDLAYRDATPTQEEAEALAWGWRTYCDDPGFNQPPGSFVAEVEQMIGETLWE